MIIILQQRKAVGKHGFTLVEVIVVLVVLAILAAIIIPAMTGWIDKARDGEAITEARHCLTAAQGIAVERYAEGKSYSLAADKGETMQLADVPAGGDMQEMTFDAYATPIQMVYKASNERIVVYKNGAFSIGAATFSFTEKDVISNGITSALQTEIGSNNGQYYRSGASDADTKKLIAAMQAAGINLDAAAATWAIHYRTDKYAKIYWTQDDLSTHKAGDVIPVMSYTLGSQNYNVWMVRLVETNGVLGIGSETSHVTKVPEAEQTYEQMMMDYNNAIAKP